MRHPPQRPVIDRSGDIMDAISPSTTTRSKGGDALLRRTAALWYAVAAIGQAAFAWMIVDHYGRKTAAGNLAGWNEKPLIKGYVAGDVTGNAMFAAHVLLAALVTIGGLLQLVPQIRRRAPALHRWIGRSFFAIGGVLAASGLWLTWVRQTYLSLISALAVSLDAVLILACCTIAWRCALRRDYRAHRRWALRAFMVVNGVWFLRIGIMAWALLSGGKGMNDHLSGPADIVIQFGAYLIPLAVLEIYLRAEIVPAAGAKRAAAGLLGLSAIITLIGAGGAVAFMWWPYMG